MRSRLRSFVFSLQTKLVLAMTVVIILAIFLAGAVFVARNRNERRDQALNRVAAASLTIQQEALVSVYNNLSQQPPQDTPYQDLDDLARQQDVRILLVAQDGSVFHDTNGGLEGQTVEAPRPTANDLRRGYVYWEPGDNFPEHNLTLISSSTRVVTRPRIPVDVVMAVKTDTIASAWLGVLPGLGLAALIAIPLASLAAIIIARQVAQPLRKLDDASEAMARGDFDQRVEVDRDDEVGHLARSFTSMAHRVGERDSQMRTLVANVSHDLKTPMTSITGYAQALADGTAPSEDAPRLGGIIRDEAEHVNRLLSDLLYLGEIDAGQVLAREEDVDLDTIVGHCVRRIEPSAREKSLAVSVEVEPDAVLRNVDPDKLERALTNVLENAAKFTPPGGDVAVRGWRENGTVPARVLCSVTNSGSSISSDDLPRVFDRFFRGDRARRNSSGSGLGLAIARELVELNRGTLRVANEDADHVTFTMTLPT